MTDTAGLFDELAGAALAFRRLCDAQRDLIEAEAELTRARAARVRAEPPPPTREQIAGSSPADAGRRREHEPGCLHPQEDCTCSVRAA